MAQNLVSQPPLNTPIVDAGGLPSRAFAIWMRDVYRRTAYKGGNAIDDNKAETDQELVDVNATLEETIVQVNGNIEGISVNADAIELNAQGISNNAKNLVTHEELEEAHGSNGNVVGFNDLADETIQGLVKRMASLTDAVASTVEVVVADAAAAPVAYSQAHSQSLVVLSNANKAAVNTLATDLNSAIVVLNDLIAKSKTSGQMTT